MAFKGLRWRRSLEGGCVWDFRSWCQVAKLKPWWWEAVMGISGVWRGVENGIVGREFVGFLCEISVG